MSWDPTVVHLPCHCFKNKAPCPQGKTGSNRQCLIAVDELLILDVMRDLTVSKFKNQQRGDRVDNQHRKIKNYRDLKQKEIDLMNKAKKVERDVLRLIKDLRKFDCVTADIPSIDGRWLSIGSTHIEQGFMAIVRSIAKPLNED